MKEYDTMNNIIKMLPNSWGISVHIGGRAASVILTRPDGVSITIGSETDNLAERLSKANKMASEQNKQYVFLK